MTATQDRLFELLPQVYRKRDAEIGYPLRALLQVIAEQVEVVEKDIAQLYENWFIETCQDWVVPYIADLIGFEPVHDAGQPGDICAKPSLQRNRILIPRAEVANTIRNRRRKGTLALLELLAQDVANWPARAVEFYTLLSYTQNLNHLRLERGRTVDLRYADALRRLDGPFDEIAHTVDIRRPNSSRTLGRYNIPSVGLFVWRLRAYSITRAPVYYREKNRRHCFTFSVLNNDAPLFTRAVAEPEPARLAGELNLPVPIRRRAFEGEEKTLPDGTKVKIASVHYYGEKKSLAIWADEWSGHNPGHNPAQPIPREAVIPTDLSNWQYFPPENHVAVDPELGRLSFPPNQMPKISPSPNRKGVWVYYHYGFVTEIGGGEYQRPIFDPSAHALSLSWFRMHDFKDPAGFVTKLKAQTPDTVSQYLLAQFSPDTRNLLAVHNVADPPSENLLAALADELTALIQAGPLYEENRFAEFEPLPQEIATLLGMFNAGELSDEELIRLNRLLLEAVYKKEIAQSYAIYRVGPGLHETIGAALSAWDADKPRDAVIEITDSGVYTESIEIEFKAHQSLQLRAALHVRPAIRLLDVSFSGPDAFTIIGAPGARFALDGLLVFGRGIHIENEIAQVNIRHSTLVPGWELGPDCEPQTPNEVSLRLVDTRTCLNVSHSILGTIQVLQSEVETDPISISISDSILDATSDGEDALSGGDCKLAHAVVKIIRSTVIGGVHAHAIKLAENSIFTGVVIVARRQIGCVRFSYVPPSIEHPKTKTTMYSRTPRRFNSQPDLVRQKAATPEAKAREWNRVRPQFNSVRYGTPNYLQLTHSTAEEIKRGADDESEMGVYHDLFQPQREANLRVRLDEYTPAGMNAGIFMVN